MYDHPYRLECNFRPNDTVVYEVHRTGEGVICRGENFMEMRRMVDAANEMTAIEQGDRGR